MWSGIGIASSSSPSSADVFRASGVWAAERHFPHCGICQCRLSHVSHFWENGLSVHYGRWWGASALRSPVFLRFVWYRYSGLVAKIMVFCLKQKHYHEKYIPRRHFFFHDTCSLHYDIYGVRLAENEITRKGFCFLLPEFISK